MATENIPSRLHSVAQGNVVTGANEILDDTKGKKQSVINQETDSALGNQDQRIQTLETAVGTGGSVDSRIESAKTEIVGGASSDCNTLGKAEALISTNANDIAALQEAYAALTQNDVVVIAPTDTWPVATPEQNTIYRVVDRENTPPQYYADYMWNGTVFVEMAQYNNAIDAVPTAGSHNLVESGGVDEIINGTSVIKGAGFESYKWYMHTAIGEPLTLNTSYNYTYAYKGLIPQGTYAIDVFGKGSTGGRLWYTLDADENVVRMSGEDMTSDHITEIQDEEIYIVVQTNDVINNAGKIIFYNTDGINQKIEELRNYTNNKLIKLAKWGTGGNPTDLHVGDVYTSNGTNLIRVDAINDGVVTRYTELPFINGAVYTLYDELYIYNGTRLQKDNRVIVLTGIVNLASSGITATGQFYFNKGTNSIWRCTHYNTTPQDSTFQEMPGLANTDTLYLCKGSVYYYDGTNMVSPIGNNIPMGDKLTVDADGKPRNISNDENYGLQVGYIWDEYYSDDQTRVSTKLLNALVKDVDIKVASNNFEIRGYTSFDANYNRIEYVSTLTNRKALTLQKGYYYSVIFSKMDTGSAITPDEIAPYIWIDDRIKLNELSDGVSPYIDTVFDMASLAEEDTWYTGMEIGSTIIKTSYNDCYAVKYPVVQNQVYKLSAHGGTGGRGWYLLDSEDKIIDLAPMDFNNTIILTIPEGVAYLIIQSNSGISYLSLSILGKVSALETKTNELQEDVEQLQQTVKKDTFKCLTPFLWNKLSRMKNLATGFCNIGFIGDSWTQGTEDIIGGVNQGDFQGYVKPLTKMLQDEYGFGGLGWLDFARDGGVGKMFGCADMYEHWSYTFEGNVTGVDAAGSPSTPAAQCFGICVAHTIFGNASSLTLNFNVGILDKFILRYYKNAHFNVSVNGGAAIEVTANSTDGWQETEFGVTGTDTTSVVITSLADDSIIFGMDCFYGNHGVRIHKIGNRSISAGGYIGMDATQWETGISKLNLCWASVLLAINDLGSSTSESTMDAIVTRIGTLINRLKVATNDGNGLVTCDINLLGVENIEATAWTGLGRLAEKQKAFALNNGYGWCSTDKCIGSQKDEFTFNGTFSDTIHLNKIGSYAYAAHIYNSLFKF